MDRMLLTLITFLPLVGMAFILCLPGRMHGLIRWTTVVISGVVFLLTLRLWAVFDPAAIGVGNDLYSGFDKGTFIELPWIASFNVNYRFGVDGLSTLLIVMTGLLSFLATFSSFPIKKSVKGFYALYLLLMTGMFGTFMSLDFFLFYVFWEVMLLPMYFLIGIWGGPRKEYAAIKFFLYTLLGSVLIQLVMLAYYFQVAWTLGLPEFSFNIPWMIQNQPFAEGSLLFRQLMFWGLFIGFAIKVPIFPFHTWLPDAHVEAPTAISVILAGVLLKMGGYGILRFNYSLLPEIGGDSTVMFFLATLGVVNIVYGAFCALGQTDFKRLVAYSSVSHMGYVLLGIAVLREEAVNGAIFQMFAHGLSSAMMFMVVGVLYERAHHREIARFGGIARQMPNYFALAVVAFFASLGLPSMVGFIGEVGVFLGAFTYNKWLTAIASSGLLLTAAYILWTMQRVYLGEPNPKHDNYPDANAWEWASIAPLAVLCVLFGVLPSIAFDIYTTSTKLLLSLF